MKDSIERKLLLLNNDIIKVKVASKGKEYEIGFKKFCYVKSGETYYHLFLKEQSKRDCAINTNNSAGSNKSKKNQILRN